MLVDNLFKMFFSQFHDKQYLRLSKALWKCTSGLVGFLECEFRARLLAVNILFLCSCTDEAAVLSQPHQGAPITSEQCCFRLTVQVKKVVRSFFFFFTDKCQFTAVSSYIVCCDY